MKKILGALACVVALTGGAMEAKAAFLDNWTYNLESVTIRYDETSMAHTSSSNGFSWTGGAYDSVITAEDLTADQKTGNIKITNPNDTNDYPGHFNPENIVSHTTETGGGNTFEENIGKYLGTLIFNYSVMAVDLPETAFDESTRGWSNVTSEVALYTYSRTLPSGELVDYVYYNSKATDPYNSIDSEGNKDLNVVNHGANQYNLSGVDLYVDGRAVVGEDGNHVGWEISKETRENLFVFDSNTGEYVLGDKKGNVGYFDIDGTFSVSYTGAGPDTTPTPEPATMLLMGAGLVGLGLVARRRNSK